MADIKKLGGKSHGRRNKDGWRIFRQEKRERYIAPIKFIGGVMTLAVIVIPLIWFGFALPG